MQGLKTLHLPMRRDDPNTFQLRLAQPWVAQQLHCKTQAAPLGSTGCRVFMKSVPTAWLVVISLCTSGPGTRP